MSREGVRRTITPMDPLVLAAVEAHEDADDAFVARAFRGCSVGRRRTTRASGRSPSSRTGRCRARRSSTSSGCRRGRRVRELDDAVALGLAARARGERALVAPAPPGHRRARHRGALGPLASRPGRARARGRLRVRGAGVPRRRCCGAGVELVGVDLAERDVEGMERLTADVRSLPLPDGSVDQVLLVSTLEHVGADNTGYGLAAESDPASQATRFASSVAWCGARRAAARHRAAGRAGRPRLVPARRRRRLERALRIGGAVRRGAGGVRAGQDGWRAAPAFDASGVGYADRGPAASAVLCTELSAGRLRRLATPDGIARTAASTAAPTRHAVR